MEESKIKNSYVEGKWGLRKKKREREREIKIINMWANYNYAHTF